MFDWLFGKTKRSAQIQPPKPSKLAQRSDLNKPIAETADDIPESRSFALPRVRMPGAIGYKIDHSDLPDSFPRHYFTKRSLADGSIALFPGTHAAETLDVSLPIWKHELTDAVKAGAKVQDQTAVINLRDVDVIPPQMDLYLPFFAKREIHPLMIDMIPETSFGASLANIQTQGSWRGLRSHAASRTGGCCQICGDRPQSIECHELWEYHQPKRWGPDTERRGVQTLVALLALCKDCHRMFHPGRAEAHGFSDEVWERIAWMNRWTGKQAAAYSRFVQRIRQQRSTIAWDLDLRIVRHWELIVQKSKVELLPDGRVRDIKSGRITGLLGVNWRFSKENEFQKASPLPDWLTGQPASCPALVYHRLRLSLRRLLGSAFKPPPAPSGFPQTRTAALRAGKSDPQNRHFYDDRSMSFCLNRLRIG